MRWQRRHHWTRAQRRSLFFFLIGILIILGVQFLLPSSNRELLIIESSEALSAAIAEWDSIKELDSISRLPERKAFNPNYITDYQANIFGIPSSSLEKIRKYRQEEKWINSAEDFQLVSGVSDSLLFELKDYFKFPDFIVQRAEAKERASEKIIRTDLNTAELSDLVLISGIGEVLGDRVIEWRNRLGGFATEGQLKHVYGLNDYARTNLLKHYYIKETEVVPSYAVNTSSASDLATIPGVNFDLARKIWEFCQLREGISNIEELLLIEEVTEFKLELIRIYLYVD